METSFLQEQRKFCNRKPFNGSISEGGGISPPPFFYFWDMAWATKGAIFSTDRPMT